MDASRYLSLFLTDAREHLAGLEADLVRFEQAVLEPDQRSLLEGVFRHLHSLKGSAGMMGFDPIVQVAHLCEQLASEGRTGIRPIATAEIDLLLDACDCVRVLVNRLADGLAIEQPSQLIERLSGAITHVARPASAAEPASDETLALDGPHTLVKVWISSTATPAARAFIVLRRLETLDKALSCSPSRETLRTGSLPRSVLTVALHGVHDLASIEAALSRVPGVDSVELAAAAEPQPLIATGPAAVPLRPVIHDPTMRVHVQLLDQLLELAGELVLSSGRLRESVKSVPHDHRAAMDEEVVRLRRLVKDLNDRVLDARQTSVQHLTDRLPRIVRDLSRRLDKPLQLEIEGADTTLDRGLLDALAEPLIHVIRNAADHGIEPPEVRGRSGKPPIGTITFAARRESERVCIELRDDGRGFDTAALRRSALSRGDLAAPDAERLTTDAALRLAFLPGLTTRSDRSVVSGTGVGLDAVLVTIEQLGGTVAVESTPGTGSCVRFLLPTTVSVMNLLLVDLGGEIFGLPMSKVLFAAQGDLSAAVPGGGPAPLLSLGGQEVSAYALGRLVGLPEEAQGVRPFVVVEGEGQRAAVGVDRLIGQEEVVLRPLGPPLEKIRGLTGTAILGSGRPIFVLDVPRLVA
jgi:two-component system chemotaxis sensor kinase CheA